MIYVIIFLALIFADHLFSLGKNKQTVKTIILLFLLFVFSAFRYEVGCDWIGYYNIFLKYEFIEFKDIFTEREVGFALINFLINKYNLSYFYINIISALLFFYGFYQFAKRQDYPFSVLVLSFPVLILNLPMSGIRQGIAVGFISMAFNAFSDRRVGTYTILVFIASTFHSSALVFLFFIPIIVMGTSIISLFISAIISSPGLYYLFQSPLEIYVARYIETDLDAAGGPFRTSTLAFAGIIFFLYLKKSWKQQSPNDYDIILISSFVMILLFVISFLQPLAADRLAYYFIPIQLCIFVKISSLSLDRGNPYILRISPYILMLSLLVIWASLSDIFELCYSQYQTILFQPWSTLRLPW